MAAGPIERIERLELSCPLALIVHCFKTETVLHSKVLDIGLAFFIGLIE
jgi:Tat protein secretion system quality control protein TatD with DNase activity